jgi:ribosome-binding factor A
MAQTRLVYSSMLCLLVCKYHVFWLMIFTVQSDAFRSKAIGGKVHYSLSLEGRTLPCVLCAYTSRSSSGSRSYDRHSGGDEKSKRQERVGQLVMTELSQIIHSGLIKGTTAEYLDDELRTRISVVSTDVSPDLRQARISISIRPVPTTKNTLTNDNDMDDIAEASTSFDTNALNNIVASTRPSPSVDRRRAYAWLVRNTKPIRHTLAQKLSHMKSCPELTFVQVDVSAAVDVMYLIDKLSSSNGNYKRENLDLFHQDDVARGVVGGLDFDAVDDDDWDEDDDNEFFDSK